MAETVGLDAQLTKTTSKSVGMDAILLPTNVRRRLTIGLNLKQNAPYQFHAFDFNSFAVFNGVPIASNEDGIFSLFDSDKDNGGDIDAFFEFPTTDLGISKSKQLRKTNVRLEASGTMILKAEVDEQHEESYLLGPRVTDQKQHRSHTFGMRRDQRGVYWRFRVENRLGCDFSMDAITTMMYTLSMGR